MSYYNPDDWKAKALKICAESSKACETNQPAVKFLESTAIEADRLSHYHICNAMIAYIIYPDPNDYTKRDKLINIIENWRCRELLSNSNERKSRSHHTKTNMEKRPIERNMQKVITLLETKVHAVGAVYSLITNRVKEPSRKQLVDVAYRAWLEHHKIVSDGQLGDNLPTFEEDSVRKDIRKYLPSIALINGFYQTIIGYGQYHQVGLTTTLPNALMWPEWAYEAIYISELTLQNLYIRELTADCDPNINGMELQLARLNRLYIY